MTKLKKTSNVTKLSNSKYGKTKKNLIMIKNKNFTKLNKSKYDQTKKNVTELKK